MREAGRAGKIAAWIFIDALELRIESLATNCGARVVLPVPVPLRPGKSIPQGNLSRVRHQAAASREFRRTQCQLRDGGSLSRRESHSEIDWDCKRRRIQETKH